MAAADRRAIGEPILTVEAVTLRFRGVTAIDDGVVRHPRGRDPGDHRTQRRRQVVDAQLHQRLLPPPGGHHHIQGRRPPQHEAVRRGEQRHRQDLPEHRAVPRHVDARQPHGRALAAHDGVVLLAAAPCRPGAARGACSPRPRRGDHRLPRDRGDPPDACGAPALRHAETRRARPRAGDGSPTCCCSTSRWRA